ncbi:MAG: Sulfotransferase [Verrucomicrobiales bacterium]|nr:Sulfotransferase [Verrucomicrobiales bacterium]
MSKRFSANGSEERMKTTSRKTKLCCLSSFLRSLRTVDYFDVMKRWQPVSESSLNRILQAAEEAWQSGDPQQAIEQLDRASRLAPADYRILLRLGQIYGFCYDYVSAEKSFEKALRIAPNKNEMLAAVARHSTDFADHKLAELYFQRSTERDDVKPETLVRLAELYEHLHRVEEASSLIERALQSDAAHPLALLARARLERQAGHLEESERLLRSVLITTDRETKIRGYYELGLVLDGQKRYDEAMSTFLEAKAMLRVEAAPLIEPFKALRARLTRMQSSISAGMFQRWFDASPALQPPRRLALLCGHPRSGTTLLEQVLDSHPDITSVEETNIFTTYAYNPLARRAEGGPLMLEVLESAAHSALNQSRQNYFSTVELHLGRSIGHRMLIDKNPSFNFFIPAYVRVFPEVKILAALRDPRDVCLSCFMQPIIPLSQRSTAYLSISDTVEEYVATMAIWRTLKPLLQHRSLEVHYEDLVGDLEAVSRRTLGFLGVSWDERVMHFDAHARTKRVRSPTYADVTKPISTRAMGRWRNYQKYLEPHLEKLDPFLKAFGYAD